jgi:hypothetical protein
MAGSFSSRRRALAPKKQAPNLPKVEPGKALRRPAPPLRGPAGPQGPAGRDGEGTTGPAGPTGAAGATGATGPAGGDSAMRRIRRHVFYTDGTCDIIENGVTNNVALTSFGLDTDGHAYRVWLVAGGTGGAKGARTTSTLSAIAAAAAAGPAVALWVFQREELEDYIAGLGTDIPITVGAAGVGASAGTMGTGAEACVAGTVGGPTFFGGLLAAFPGGKSGIPSAVNTTAAQVGAGGGGWLCAGNDGQTTQEFGGAPMSAVPMSAAADGDYGGGKGDRGLISGDDQGAGAAIYGGGGGGGQVASAAANGRPGGRSLFGVPGPGAGGSISSSGGPRRGGDAGGRGFNPSAGVSPQRQTGGGPSGGNGATNANGVDGADGADGILGLYPGESGAGGGAADRNTAGQSVSGRGGDGGFPGGSGGGGGSSRPSGGGETQCARGGNASAGVAVVDTLG